MHKPLVAVTTDTRELDGYEWHATPRQYIDAVMHGAALQPLLVPNLGGNADFNSLFDAVDGILVTGSKTNIQPKLYGRENNDDGPFDPERDATTLPLINQALSRGVPLLAICRGIQELNVALGGTLATRVHEQPGNLDHRGPEDASQNERFAIRHPVIMEPDSCLAGVFGTTQVNVNSVHGQGLAEVSDRLRVEARAEDGTVEAVSLRGAHGFALGVQWHPEYWASSDDASARIFHAFGEAVRRYGAERRLRNGEDGLKDS